MLLFCYKYVNLSATLCTDRENSPVERNGSSSLYVNLQRI
jgi:hypothetical protein